MTTSSSKGSPSGSRSRRGRWRVSRSAAGSSSSRASGSSGAEIRCTVRVVGSATWYGSAAGSGVWSYCEIRTGTPPETSSSAGAGAARTAAGGGIPGVVGVRGRSGISAGAPLRARGASAGGAVPGIVGVRGRSPGAPTSSTSRPRPGAGAGWLALLWPATSVASSAWQRGSSGAISRMLRHTAIACCVRP